MVSDLCLQGCGAASPCVTLLSQCDPVVETAVTEKAMCFLAFNSSFSDVMIGFDRRKTGSYFLPVFLQPLFKVHQDAV